MAVVSLATYACQECEAEVERGQSREEEIRWIKNERRGGRWIEREGMGKGHEDEAKNRGDRSCTE